MLSTFRLHIAQKLLNWSNRLDGLSSAMDRQDKTVLIFFHGYSLAHTIRPLVIARALKSRGYHVVLAGRGPHTDRVQREGFEHYDVETMPQSRMDEYVERGDYAYYDEAWIKRCVCSERVLIRQLKPDLVIHDMKPTVELSVRLEGVDDARITQGYNQPGYADPIKAGVYFKDESDPFAEYLAAQDEDVKPQRSFYLMADIPEFHPQEREVPGYYYVGPLHDRPAAPNEVALLDQGWDTSLPLIYVTCGSSGRSPDYLEGLIEACKGKPYRVLITTAGRWSGEVHADNVRVVDYMPGEWVLARAQVLVGVTGIGAIYQALRYGVPVIGAPEHLDQEYHLNRVEALGVGIKLDRRAFAGEAILTAVERVLGTYNKYRSNCAPFVEALPHWEGGDRVAELVDAHFSHREQAYRVDDDYLYPEERFVDYLVATTPLERECVEEILADGVQAGIPHRYVQGSLYFDRSDAWNWLYDNEPRFFEADYQALEVKRQRFSTTEGGQVAARHTWQGYRAAFRLRIHPDDIEPGQRVRVHLPVPVEKEGHQRYVRMLASNPAGIEAHHAPSLGCFYGYEFAAEDGPWDFGYICELSVRALRQGVLKVRPLTPAERARYLELEDELLVQPEVVRFRGLMRDIEDDEAKVRAIYDAIARYKRFKKTKDRSHNYTYCAVSVLNGTGGHCVMLTRAFISLCRAEGIPAREVNGALIGYPVGERSYRAEGRNEMLAGHAWAEVYLEGTGWMPVEFHGIVIGEQAMTGRNVANEQVRGLIEANGPLYADYYCGQLDNQRLIYAAGINDLPLYQVEDQAQPTDSPKRWRTPDGLRFDCTLDVECL